MKPRGSQRLLERLVALVVDIALHCPDSLQVRAAARLACRAHRAGVMLTRRELRRAAADVAWLRDYAVDPLARRVAWAQRVEAAERLAWVLGPAQVSAARALRYALRVACGRELVPGGEERAA